MQEKRSYPLTDSGIPAFHHYDPYHARNWEHIKELISSNTPISIRLYPGKHYPMNEEELFKISDREGHVVNIVGYDEDTREVFLFDPWNNEWGGERGGLVKIAYNDLVVYNVNCTRGSITPFSPLEISLQFPEDMINVGQNFLITASINYKKPRFISASENHIHSLHAKLKLPSSLKLVNDNTVKRVGDGYIQPGEIHQISWLVNPKEKFFGDVTVQVKGIVSSMDPYPYSDIIGGMQIKEVNIKENSSINV